MKKRILLISLAVVLALSLGLIGCQEEAGPQPSTKIIIGMSRSVSGYLSIIHTSAFGAVYPTYINLLNAGGAGGITVTNGPDQPQTYLVDTKVLNDDSSPMKVLTNMSTLVADVKAGRVHTIFGPTCTAFIDVAAPVANNGKCVLMTVEGGATFLIDPAAIYRPNLLDWPYVFVNLSFSDWYQLPVLAPLLKNGGGYSDGDGDAADTAYIFWQDDAHGREYLATAQAEFEDAGLIEIVGNTSVLDSAGPNYGNLLYAANQTSPDVVCCFCYPDEIIGLTLTAKGGGYDFDAWVVGPGGCFGWFGTGPPIGASAEDIITFAVANNKTSPAMQNLFNNVLAGGAVPGQDFWGHPLYWAAMEIWEDAVANVGEAHPGGFLIDQDLLKDDIRSHKDSTSALTTVLGPTWYTLFPIGTETGGGCMAYQCHPGEIGQWQSQYLEIIGGNNLTSTINYPKQNW